jgi:hypothetical protein
MARANAEYSKSVFINCPFDGDYSPMFEAVVFTIFDCGFQGRCALEIDDSGQIRIEKIFNVIAECRFGIHDLSRTELDGRNGLPRFNMPLELGIFLGAKRYGARPQKQKVTLILDSEEYRYQAFISDIAGQDVRAHDMEPLKAISVVRNWLRSASEDTAIPGGNLIGRRYGAFRRQLPVLKRALRLSKEDKLTFNDYTSIVSEWLKENS